ncbi:MAG: TRAP transporter substrate-binding protein DctP [Thermodesulfobacteriota bacterium]
MKPFRLTVVTLFLALCLLLAGAGNALAVKTGWKIATLAPKGLGWAVSFEKLITPWIQKATDDQYVFKVYWGGVMGNDDDYIRKMRIGQLQGAGMTGLGANLACPEFSVVGLPFLFNNYEEVDYIRKVMFPTFEYYFHQNGYKLMLWIDQDFDQFYSTKYKFDNLEDFKKTKILTWYGPQEEAMLKALGSSPIPMDVPSVPTAKRQGVLDTNIAPSIWQVGAQLYTVDKYVNPMRMRYSPAVVVVTNEAYQQVPADYQKRLEKERERVQRDYCADIRKDNEKCLKAMTDYGVQKVTVPPEVLAEIKRRAMTVYDNMSGDLFPTELLQELKRHLAAYRSGKGESVAAPVLIVKTEAPKPAVAEKPVLATAAVPPEAAKIEKESVPVEKQEQKFDAAARKETKEIEEKVDLKKMAQAFEETQQAQKKAAVEKAAEPAPAAPSAAELKEKKKLAWAERKRLVTEVQKKLNSLGLYSYEIDGIYGPVTRKGIQTYQEKNGLETSGVVDQTLLDHMGIK